MKWKLESTEMFEQRMMKLLRTVHVKKEKSFKANLQYTENINTTKKWTVNFITLIRLKIQSQYIQKPQLLL